tara:strand:- start:433 stop:873 length:441 start_codon:yes stop_codon:yes gene_type:complete
MDKVNKIKPNINSKVSIYGNLNNRVMSYKENGGKVQHYINKIFTLNNCKFSVQQGGHKTIVKKQQRAVVAHLRGTLTSVEDNVLNDPFKDNKDYLKVTYNPKQYPNRNYFYLADNGERVETAAIVYAVAAENINTRTRLITYIKRG